ncbi:ATP-dependent helicase [Stratiformator vulcanicus]|uniref:DNA 3'-5' helicase n=1 Tax=Stratiformator vulcanicus TaxID=2527980 RepID=A0A517QZJ7_9PLAN|nr:UvrD-helicase domain-containing protein [Stratiformator vulcanicus]QDT37059.1 ATP-dependent DNA helicase PcrA [Stratiformator vulcanicus]
MKNSDNGFDAADAAVAGSGANDLTEPQNAAVEHFEGPLLVLAGPGSGKTRVITRRIARLVERGVDPREILAITFTNKAAGEMGTRVQQLLPGAYVWVSTFHRFCARLLRKRPEAVGLKTNFSIYDTADQQQLMKQVLRDLDIDATHYSPRKLLHQIGHAKNAMITAETYARQFNDRVGDHMQSVTAKVYPAYQRALLDANAVDFDDLLLHVVMLLSENEEIRSDLDNRFKFVLVDEYQDTNTAQYTIVRALAQDEPHVCVTGDPDQSIYGWRGAKIENILKFERDYPDATTIRLEDNFRSTKSILKAADDLIAHNVHRKKKVLRTQNDDGRDVTRMRLRDGKAEAEAIAERIVDAHREEGRPYSDIAIFYRVNALSREIERALGRQKIPYQVAAGTAFYDRAEVKDVLGYLRLIANPDDVVAFRRIVNKPKRAIGDKTQQRVTSWAEEQRVDAVEASRHAEQIKSLSKRAATSVKKFGALIDALDEHAEGPVGELMKQVLDQTGYAEELKNEDSEESMQRLANVEELLTAACEYDREAGEEGSLPGFLEQTSLTNETDTVDEEAGKVTLMTLHAAKGLEFPVVFVVAVEQMLLPHERSLKSHSIMELEEERRLLFVGITRAMEELTLSHVERREFRGRPTLAVPSEFLSEMNLEVDDRVSDPGRGGPAAAEEWENHSDFDDFAFGDASEETENSNEKIEESPKAKPSQGQPKVGGLTTGAALLGGGTSQQAELRAGFAVGDKVRHPRYGTGIVVETDGFARNRRVTVEFEDSQDRATFVADKSPLQPIGLRP